MEKLKGFITVAGLALIIMLLAPIAVIARLVISGLEFINRSKL